MYGIHVLSFVFVKPVLEFIQLENKIYVYVSVNMACKNLLLSNTNSSELFHMFFIECPATIISVEIYGITVLKKKNYKKKHVLKSFLDV